MYFDKLLKSKNIKLTEQQSKAVRFYKGISLLLAVPGSGKTTSIICRNANLMLEHSIRPKNICNITFSKAAAIEMENRFKKIFPELDSPYFSTIHSLSYQIVREYLQYKNINFTLIEGNTKINKSNILNRIFLEINKEYPSEELTEQVNSFISYVRNSLIDINNFIQSKKILEDAEEQFENPKEIYNAYMKIKKENNWIDFDDMLCIANNILKTKHYISKKFRKMFEFIQIDEAQDVSKVQYEVAKQLAKDSGNLCLIADDDQCIYSWRGSDPSILLDLKEEFSTTEIIYMERNFRSAPVIVSKCNEFIKNNKKRYEKSMYTSNEFEGNIYVKKHSSVIEQAKNVTEQIKVNNNFRDTAILYRNNSSALPIILECIDKEIPFNIRVKNNSIFKKFILDDILSFYIFANDMTNKEAFLNIAYKLNAIYIPKAKLKYIVQNAPGNIITAIENTNKINMFVLTKLKIKLSNLKRSKNAIEFLKILFNEFNYIDYILKRADANSIDILYALAKNENHIEKVIEKIADLLDKLTNKRYEPNGINMLTLHSSKGLEWKDVFIIDFNDNIIPNEKSDKEEERRLAYVGFSRAIKRLYINFYSKGYEPLYPSVFISEFLPKKDDINSNKDEDKKHEKEKENVIVHDKIIHLLFGAGYVIDINKDIITIKFLDYGVKKLSQRILKEKNLIKKAI